jgi:hypothetical protein
MKSVASENRMRKSGQSRQNINLPKKSCVEKQEKQTDNNVKKVSAGDTVELSELPEPDTESNDVHLFSLADEFINNELIEKVSDLDLSDEMKSKIDKTFDGIDKVFYVIRSSEHILNVASANNEMACDIITNIAPPGAIGAFIVLGITGIKTTRQILKFERGLHRLFSPLNNTERNSFQAKRISDDDLVEKNMGIRDIADGLSSFFRVFADPNVNQNFRNIVTGVKSFLRITTKAAKKVGGTPEVALTSDIARQAFIASGIVFGATTAVFGAQKIKRGMDEENKGEILVGAAYIGVGAALAATTVTGAGPEVAAAIFFTRAALKYREPIYAVTKKSCEKIQEKAESSNFSEKVENKAEDKIRQFKDIFEECDLKDKSKDKAGQLKESFTEWHLGDKEKSKPEDRESSEIIDLLNETAELLDETNLLIVENELILAGIAENKK